jgi:mannitol-1-phosphate 5-dehydrogenase
MKSAVIYGAGSIGMGFIGQLFSESGYHVVFVDINRPLIGLLNERGQYPLRFVEDARTTEVIVRNVSGLCAGDSAAVYEAIGSAGLMATSVGKNALPAIAESIAGGLRLRWSNGNFNPLNIIVCENMLGANTYLRELILQRLHGAEKRYFHQYTGMVETCIGRNVPVMTEELRDGDPLRVIAEPYNALPVDSKTFVGPVPDIKHMKPCHPFGYYIRQKLFVYNMAHTLTAYLGSLLHIGPLAEAIRQEDIRRITDGALREAGLALAREYHADPGEINAFCGELLHRFENRRLGIAVWRVARDSKRKLSPDDRLAGALEMCLRNGVAPAHIAVGIAAGYCYCGKDDPASLEIHGHITAHGFDSALEKYSGIRQDRAIHGYIVSVYKKLRDGASLKEIADHADSREINVL